MSQRELIETVQLQSIGEEVVYLFEVELEPDSFIYFHSGFNIEDVSEDLSASPRQYAGTIQFKHKNYPTIPSINTYIPIPCSLEGVELSRDGPSSRPRLSVANVLETFQNELGNLSNDDLIGKKVLIRTTLRKYLIEASIRGGTDIDDGVSSPVEFSKSLYVIDRIAELNPAIVSFELASPIDLPNITLPGRKMVGKYCSWKYQGRDSVPAVGGCYWKRNGESPINPGQFFFFNVKDEPLVNIKIQSSSGWSAFLNDPFYAADTKITYLGKYYVAATDIDQGGEAITPGTSSGEGSWVPIRFWSEWDPNPQITYNIDSTDPYNNDYVLYPGLPGTSTENPEVNSGIPTVWRCVRSHTSGEDTHPKLGSTLWELAEVCGKTIKSCKIRYQAAREHGANYETFPSLQNFDTTIPLPFGAFPGTVKFR